MTENTGLLLDTVILQNCMNIQRVVIDFSSQMCPTTSDDENEFVKIKVEEDIYIKEEDEQVLVPAVKFEYEVSCESVSPMLDTFHSYPVLHTVCIMPICRHNSTNE